MASHDELQTICTKLSDYFNKVSANVTDNVSALPMFEDYASLLVVDSILTEAVDNEKGAANYSSGAKTDIVHLIAGIQREFGMRGRTKINYFINAPTSIALTSEAFRTMYGKYLNYFRGSAPEQGNK